MPTWLAVVLQVLGFILSAAAFAVSLSAYRRSSRLTDLQTRIATLELANKKRSVEAQARADVAASIIPTGHFAHRLIIENRGVATAADVEIEVTGDGEGIFPAGERERHLPISELVGGDHVSILVALASGRWPPFDIVLTWTDPDGTTQRKEGK